MSFFNRKKDEVNTSTTSKTINYTVEYPDLDSALVWDAYYDAENHTAVLSLEGVLYEYRNVPEEAVMRLVDAHSIGSAFSRFKREYGPSTRLGDEVQISKVKRPSTPAPGLVGKNLTYAPNATVDGSLVTAKDVAEPKRVPLTLVDEPAAAEKRTYTVHFESNGSKTYSLEAVSVDEAVEALKQAAEMLGVRAKVTGVFVHLG